MKIRIDPALSGVLLGTLLQGTAHAAIPSGEDGFHANVKPFFENHCVKCHGPDKNKGKITLHTMDGDLAGGQELERWETILDVLKYEEMPPEDEPQPDDAERQAVAEWIESGLRDYVSKASSEETAPVARRLTNFEYQNTLRDLLGFELKVIADLPLDPVTPYKFNNTAQFMLVGPEQLDRYLEIARRAMASAIVDPAKPKVHTTRAEWQPTGSERGFGQDELPVWPGRKGSPSWGAGIRSFPDTGEFRVRFQASAILPEGYREVPVRMVMGNSLSYSRSTDSIEPIGTVYLRNTPEKPEVFEFRGRIENLPIQLSSPGKKGGTPQAKLTVTPQNLYDDGTRNDSRSSRMPRAVINWIEFEAPVADSWPPAHHMRILFDSPHRESHPDEYVREVLNRFISRAFRRPADRGEVAQFEKVYALIRPDVDSMEAAMRETLAMVLIAPQFLYHTVADHRVVLPPYELASKLSYFLWGGMPDAELLKLAETGELTQAQVIKTQVLRLLANERSENFVRNFVIQWMDLEKLKTIPINADLFPEFLYYVPEGPRKGNEMPGLPSMRDYMVDETVGFIAELIRRDASATNLVDSDFAWLNQPLAAHYGVKGVEGLEFRTVPLNPEHHLGGVLTHGSILVANGTGSAPHPIYRAVWLREAILGDEVAPPPAEVPALSDSAGESAEKAISIKDLLARHRTQESCNDCHVRLDPWGIPFEHFNATGRFQPRIFTPGAKIRSFSHRTDGDLDGYHEYLNSISTVEIEARARVPHGPTVNGMDELKEFLLRERMDDVAENVLRRLTTYGLGRQLTYQDRFEIEKILQNSEKDGYSLKGMIVAICQSPLFTAPTSTNPTKP